MSTDLDFRTAGRSYNDALNSLMVGHPEDQQAFLELDSLVGDYVNEGIQQGIRRALMGKGFVTSEDLHLVEALNETIQVSELAEAAGLGGRVWFEFCGARIKVDGAQITGNTVVLWSESPLINLTDRLSRVESTVAGMKRCVRTETLEVVDRRGQVHIQAYAGEDFGSLWVAARDANATDGGAACVITASEEDPEAPSVYAVTKLGDEDQVVGAIGTEHPYGLPVEGAVS